MRALAALLLALPLSAELRLEFVRESLTGMHCRYREYTNGVPHAEYIVKPCANLLLPAARGEGARSADEGPRITRDGRMIRREIVAEHPLQPFAYEYDGETLVRKIPLFFHAKAALVFDPNPVVALNDPSLQDQNDAASAVPANAYQAVTLDNLAANAPLRGPHVTLVDRQAPNVAPPSSADNLAFNREQDGFEDVQTYFHIDRNQRYLQSIGYRGARAIAPYSIEADAHAAGGLDNSLFLPSLTRPGFGALFFGEGGTDDAEDADLVVHEYAHALHEWIAPSTFTGTFASQARAFSEAFGDYWAFSTHFAQRAASGRDLYCFADWDPRCWLDDPSQNCAYPPGTNCLRRLDSTRTMAGYETGESPGVEHRNSQIFSSALREIFVAIGKHFTDTIVLESLFDAPPQPSFAVMARRLLDADVLLYGGAHAGVICDAMTKRGILVAGACAIVPRGEWTHFVARERELAIPEANPAGVTSSITIEDPHTIENLFVRVDIRHTSRGDLKVELIAPDGTIVVLHQPTLDRTPDIHATFGVDAATVESLEVFRGRSAAGTWRLRVSDLRTRDAGVLQSWALVIQFAGVTPLAERPRATERQMIPVVAHRHGERQTFFASDVRIANVSATKRRSATLIYTPGGEDGLTTFSAINVQLEPGQTIAFDDVLQSAFHTSGSGSLEILGDVIAWSRTYTNGIGGGTVGQQIPPMRRGVGESGAIKLTPLLAGGARRVNVGITEVLGSFAQVRVTGIQGDVRTFVVPPFSNIQIAYTAPEIVIDVIGGTGRIVAYASVIDNITNDAYIIHSGELVAFEPAAESYIAPVTRRGGINNTNWITDLVFSTFRATDDLVPATLHDSLRGDRVDQQLETRTHIDILGRFGRETIGALELQMTREVAAYVLLRTPSAMQSIPMRPASAFEYHLLFIESSERFRTNIGIVSSAGSVAEVTVYDAAGNEILRDFLWTERGGVAQLPVLPRVSGGRALVRILFGRARAYASMIDNVSTDATFVEGQ